ncbi:MAG: bifunctional 2-polyprenyl-6-hydroxyphenol methylase/3-demethylubiquinol 3-O-methyltransferase UbiG [Gammaproteobacteria bacterium]|nr:bifunctional 2-polyprenyl-6-hydroxyphenol methylase/3-demethylubiquinol 3-O-methyltransferase UbiG [Gammaproteobacteria bacterium]
MNNQDAAEIAQFDALAGQWWDPNGPLWTLHAINPLRMDFIRTHTPLTGLRVLDVGCGGGLLTEALAREGAKVTGIDLAAASLATARMHAQSQGLAIQYRLMPVEELAAAEPEGFDVVTCMEMLEHVPDPAAIVQACAALVKPGGWLILSTLNRTPKAFALAIVGAEYLLGMIPRGTHSFRKFIRPAELARWLRAAGMGLADQQGLHYNPLARQFLLGPGVDVNYLVAARKPS